MKSDGWSRYRKAAVVICLLVAIALLAPLGSSAQSSSVDAGIKQCRHRFAGKGRKGRQAVRRCIKKVRSKQLPEPESPTKVDPVAPAPPDAPSPSPATPGAAGETVASPVPSTPAGPSVPDEPIPLELEMPAVEVTIGSTIYRSLPLALRSLSTIESITGAEPGVTVQMEGERVVISASEEASPALLHLVIAGVACTASECGRHVLIRLRLTVDPTMVQLVEVDPNGPTHGPAGFGPGIVTPSCSYLRYGFDNGRFAAGIGLSRPRETFDTHTPADLPIGPHTIWFDCLTGRGGPVLWWSEGFEITVTGASVPIGLESSTVPAGGELVFTTGPSLSADQCPPLPGVTVNELLLNLNATVPGGPLVNHRNVSMPDGLATERLLVPSESPAGTYSVLDRCIYGNGAGERAIYEFAGQTGEVTVTGS